MTDSYKPQPWNIYDAVEPYLFPDLHEDDDRIYQQYDAMCNLFKKTTLWNRRLASDCIRTYLECTKPVEVKPAYLCYFMFQSVLPDNIEKSAEDTAILKHFDTEYGVEELYETVSATQVQYEINPDFDAEIYDPDAMDVMRIRGIALTRKDLNYYESELSSAHYIKDFAESSMDMLVKLGTSDNKRLEAEKDDLIDQILDVFSAYQKKKERETKAFPPYHPPLLLPLSKRDQPKI